MMLIKRNGDLVIGLTDANILDLEARRILRLRPDDIGVEGLTLYILRGENHEAMRTELLRAGWNLDDFKPPAASD